MKAFTERFLGLYDNGTEKQRKELNEKGFNRAFANLYDDSPLAPIAPPPEALIEIADIFNCSVDYLLGRTEYQNMRNRK